MKKVIIFFFFFFFILSAQAFCKNSSEIRALWVKFEELTSKDKIDQLINTAKENNINLIFAQVRRLGVVLYPSEIEKTSSLVAENFDPLDYLLSRAHQEKIEVHAWLNIFYVWTRNQEIPAEHSARHRDWLLETSNSMIFLNPANPEVQNQALNLIAELAVSYPVDGIHLDYIRYPHDTSDGYQEFLSDNSNTALPKTKEFWVTYRRDQLTELVRKISGRLYNINPQIKLSAAVIPDIREATYYKGQDWPRWLGEGLIDFAALMCYSTDWSTIKNQVSEAVRNSPNRYIVAGLGVWRQSTRDTSNQIFLLRKLAQEKNYPTLKGFALFSYDSLKSQPDSWTLLKKSVLSWFAELPEMPWKKQKLSAGSAENIKLLANRNIFPDSTELPDSSN